MKFIINLYCQFFWFQKKVGNGDVAHITSPIIITFVFNLYLFALYFLVMIIYPNNSLFKDKNIVVIIFTLYFLLLLIFLYYKFLYKNRYISILKEFEPKIVLKKNRLIAFMFPILGFALLLMLMYLKLLQNQDKIL